VELFKVKKFLDLSGKGIKVLNCITIEANTEEMCKAHRFCRACRRGGDMKPAMPIGRTLYI
jgi:hypothetical protein